MASYKIYFRKSAAKELGKLPNPTIQKVVKRIEALAIDPRPVGCEKLTGQEFYRVRKAITASFILFRMMN